MCVLLSTVFLEIVKIWKQAKCMKLVNALYNGIPYKY